MTGARTIWSSARIRAALLVTELTGPAVSVVAALALVAVYDARHGDNAALWAVVAALLCAGVPMTVILAGVRSGRWGDHHLTRRDQRLLPLGVGVLAVLAAGALLLVGRAPRDLIALIGAMLVGLLSVLLITRWWKISIHTAVAAGVVGIAIVLYGAGALAALAVVGLIGWSRTVLDAHTLAQVVAGAAVGLAAASATFPLLR